ncbi:MAG: PqqD family protein [Candidatus Contendobacter sp.]
MINSTARIQIPTDVLYRDLGGEAVIANLTTGQYYGLDEIGARTWTLLVEHGQLEPAVQTLLAEYAVEERQLRQDLSQLLNTLADHGLLQIVTA